MSGLFSTGGIAFVVLLSAALTIPAALVLVGLYQRSVRRTMSRRTMTPARIEPSEPSVRTLVVPAAALTLHEATCNDNDALQPAARQILSRAMVGPWRAVAVYAIAGLAWALLSTLLYILPDGHGISALQLVVVMLVFGWPAILTMHLITDAGRAIQIRNTVIYLALILVLMQFKLLDFAFLVGPFVGVPSLLLLAFMYPRVRTIGPLVFTFMVIGIFGANLVLVPFEGEGGQRAAAGALSATGLDALTFLVLSAIVGFAVASLAGWGTLAWVRRQYDARSISDQSLSIDAIWLIFTLFSALLIASSHPAVAFLEPGTFVAYRLLVALGFGVVSGTFGVPQNHRLLLLRVFGSAHRSKRLMAHIGARWRYVGSIELITGTDLATSTLDPDDFLEFVRGRLGNRHIRDRDALERHVAEMDLEADFDTRFRINQFLCYDDTWRVTLTRLVELSDAVLVDLRGFSPANQGVVFELESLINLVPLSRVVLLVDATTDVPFLRSVLDQTWAQMAASSPNAAVPNGQLVVCRMEDPHDSSASRILLRRLAQASIASVGPMSPAPSLLSGAKR